MNEHLQTTANAALPQVTPVSGDIDNIILSLRELAHKISPEDYGRFQIDLGALMDVSSRVRIMERHFSVPGGEGHAL